MIRDQIQDLAGFWISDVIEIILRISVFTVDLTLHVGSDASIGRIQPERRSIAASQHIYAGLPDFLMGRQCYRPAYRPAVFHNFFFVAGDLSVIVVYRIDISCIAAGIRGRIAVRCHVALISQRSGNLFQHVII